MSWCLAPLALVYGWITDLRNKFYDIGFLKTHQVSRPVVSVGNLTVGGTGKTPLISSLVELCLQKKLSVAVVSRGYKGSYRQASRVTIDDLSAAVEKHGDEPCLLAWKFPEVAVFTGSDRVKVCEKAIEEFSPDIILADDAFQHRRLRRDMDLVILDATVAHSQYRLLPWGRSRERMAGLARSSMVVFSKVNLVAPHHWQYLRDRVSSMGLQRNSLFASYSSSCLIPLERFRSGSEVARCSWVEMTGRKCLLVCGIGNPDAFEEMVVSSGRIEVVGRLFFADHFSYTDESIASIVEEKNRLGADLVLCTEKDGVKLVRWSDRLPQTLMVSLEMSIRAELESAAKESLDQATEGLAEKLVELHRNRNI